MREQTVGLLIMSIIGALCVFAGIMLWKTFDGWLTLLREPTPCYLTISVENKNKTEVNVVRLNVGNNRIRVKELEGRIIVSYESAMKEIK
jgi:hypothetical protein